MNPPANDPRSAAIAAGAVVEQFKPKTAKAPDFKFRFELADDIEIEGSPEWVIDDLLPLNGLAAIYGPPGCGKSFLAIDAGMHIAAGRDWFGREVQPRGVVYLAAEAGRGIRKRIKACRQGHGFTGPVPFAAVTVAPNLGTTKTAVDGKEVSDVARLIEEIDRQKHLLGDTALGVVFIDTLARTMFGADENSAADMGAFIANAGRIADHFNCLVVAVHHNGKNEAAGMRGSSALHGACDAEWEVKALGETKTVLLVKNKEGEDGLNWSFRLGVETVFDPGRNKTESVALLAHSKPITSCFVEPATLPQHSETARTRKAPKGEKKIVLDAVRDALAEYGVEMPQSPDLPSGKGVKREFIKENAFARGLGADEQQNAKRTRFGRSLSGLAADGWIAMWEDWVWLAS